MGALFPGPVGRAGFQDPLDPKNPVKRAISSFSNLILHILYEVMRTRETPAFRPAAGRMAGSFPEYSMPSSCVGETFYWFETTVLGYLSILKLSEVSRSLPRIALSWAGL